MEKKTPDSRAKGIFQFQLPLLPNSTHKDILEAKEFYNPNRVQHFGRHTNSCVRSFPMFCEPKRLISQSRFTNLDLICMRARILAVIPGTAIDSSIKATPTKLDQPSKSYRNQTAKINSIGADPTRRKKSLDYPVSHYEATQGCCRRVNTAFL